MEKNRNLLVLISLIVIVLLFRYSGFLGSLFAPEDDYVIFDDFSEGVITFPDYIDNLATWNAVSQVWLWPQIGYATFWNDKYIIEYKTKNINPYPDSRSYRPLITDMLTLPVVENGELKIYSQSCGSLCSYPGSERKVTKITINKDIKGIDFKFDLGFSGSSGYELYPGYSIWLNDISVYTYSWGLVASSGSGAVLNKDMFKVETKSHLLDKNLIDVYVKGVYVNTFNITDDEVKASITPTISSSAYAISYTYIDNIKYRVQFNCEIGLDEMLVTEIYTSGETIQMDNDQKISADGCKVESWCRRHPAFIITNTGSTSDEGDEIYESMTSGYPLTVPAGETWQLFFITKKTSTGRCEGYVPPVVTFEPIEITTVTSPQTIYPGMTKTFETEHIDITDFPQVLKATFLIKAVGGGLEQTKDEVIVFKK